MLETASAISDTRIVELGAVPNSPVAQPTKAMPPTPCDGTLTSEAAWPSESLPNPNRPGHFT